MSSVFQSTISSTPFRGPSATRTYAARVRWLVGGLLSLVVLLTAALFLLFQNANFEREPEKPITDPVTNSPSRASILIARQRIEAGTPLNDALFDTEEISSEYMPEGAVLSSERGSILGQYAKEMINAGFPVSRGALTPAVFGHEELLIPPGYRAIAIPIDEVRSVSYNIRQNSRVDVNLTFTLKGQPAVVPVVQTVKILKIGVNNDSRTAQPGAQTATLLVTADDARKIELAQKLGELSLVLAGDTEVPTTITNPVPIDPTILFGPSDQTPKAEPRVDGTFASRDPKTGEEVIIKLINGRWTRQN